MHCPVIDLILDVPCRSRFWEDFEDEVKLVDIKNSDQGEMVVMSSVRGLR
jgi:hypothetical protein